MNSELIYQKPATVFEEALPLGNGRIGAMVFGGIGDERIALNEDTLWSGRPQEPPKQTSEDTLESIRHALRQEDYAEAAHLCGNMHLNVFSESYLPAGDLRLHLAHPGVVSDYRRELDLDTGVAKVCYRSEDAEYTRTAFVSHPDQMLVIRFECTAKARITMGVRFASQLSGYQRFSDSCLGFEGTAPAHVSPSYFPGHSIEDIDASGHTGMRFSMAVEMKSEGGAVHHTHAGLNVTGADTVELRVSLATSFNGSSADPVTDGVDEKKKALHVIQAVGQVQFPTLLERHTNDFSVLSNRCRLEMPANDKDASDTLTRIREFAEVPDPSLAALYFNYGRYLMISSSRPGTTSANLQGIWNEHLRPPWSSNYTTNINCEMNYWPVETANLSECHSPFFDLIDTIQPVGKKVAKQNYGAGGWCCHHNSDIWGFSSLVYFAWPMAGVWMCAHFMEHYRFTLDKDFLRDRAWPAMKGAAEFCLDWLIPWEVDGQEWLVTAPSTSPENNFRVNGKVHGVSVATTMDMSLIRELFQNLLEMKRVLDLQDPIFEAITSSLDRLYPFKTGEHGELLEFYKPFDEPFPHHRHLSHLYGAYPSDLIQKIRDPELSAAVEKSMERRGDDATGWSFGWKSCLWARLHDGEHAWKIIKMALRLVETEVTSVKGGGVYPNMFDAHPPFQIDGNFGVTAGIAEMLLQSHERTDEGVPILRILPALPDDWNSGSVTGLCARGGFKVDIIWDNGVLEQGNISCTGAETCQVVYRDNVWPLNFESSSTTSISYPSNGC